jgi:hypothetical protein
MVLFGLFHSVKYGISKAAKTAHNFTPTEANLLGTIEELFHNLNREGKLSDTDFKTRNISLQIYAYEADMVRTIFLAMRLLLIQLICY